MGLATARASDRRDVPALVGSLALQNDPDLPAFRIAQDEPVVGR